MSACPSASLESALLKWAPESHSKEQNKALSVHTPISSKAARSSISSPFERRVAPNPTSKFAAGADRTTGNSTANPTPKATQKQRRSSLRKGWRKLLINSNQRLTGNLSETDRRNAERQSRFADDYLLKGIQPGQWISISLNSGSFDAYLQLINPATGRVIAQNDYADLGSNNSRLGFVAQAGINYQVRVTSYGSGETGKYTLITRTSPEILPGDYNYDYGYGLVNAAAAVSRALNQPEFVDVPDTGGINWGLDMVKASEVWAQGFTGQGITVAVLDTGIDYDHIDLKDNLWLNPNEIAGNGLDDDRNGFIDDVRGWNFTGSSNNDPMDYDSHGTHVAGTIAAVNNGFGVTGVAYNAKIMPIKVIGQQYMSIPEFDANVASGIRYAVDNGARVINMSLGNNPGEPPMPLTQAALQYAKQAGVIAVMASGNEKQDYGATQPIQPASYASFDLGIAVGAVNIRQQVASFSNPAGSRPLDFVVAPGVSVYSTVPGNSYTSYRGTSMATPHVAGVVALMLSANPTLTADQVTTNLLTTATTDRVTVF